MANDGKKFDIEIGTSADTAGLEQVKRELEAVEQAGKEAANPMADGSQLSAGAERAAAGTRKVEEALQDTREAAADVADEVEKIGDKVEEISPEKKGRGFDDLFKQQRLQGIGIELRQLAGTLGDVTRRLADTDAGAQLFAGMSEEVKSFGTTALTVASGVAQGYAQGGPIGAAIGGLNGLIKTVADSFIESNERIKQAEKELETAQLAHAARQRERRREATNRDIESRYAAETAELKRQNDEIERGARLRKAVAGRDDAAGEAADQQALASGVSPNLVAAMKAQRDLAAQIAELESGLRDESERVNNLFLKAQDEARRATEVAKENGTQSEEAEQAAADARQSSAAALTALGDLQSLAQETAPKIDELKIRAATEVGGLVAEAETAITTEVTTAISKIEAKAVEQGGKLSGLAGDSLQGLYDLVRDNIPDSAQLGRIETLMANFRSSSEGRDAKLIEGLDGVVAAIRKRDAEIDRLNGQIQELNRRMPNF